MKLKHLAWLSAGLLLTQTWAQPNVSSENATGQNGSASSAFKKKASISVWGGYTLLMYSQDQDDFENTCNNVKTSSGLSDLPSCEVTLKGFAGGLDLWMGDVAQFGIGVQYMRLAHSKYNYDYTVSVTGGPPTFTVTNETVTVQQELLAHYLPVMVQLRINPKYFFVGAGVGAAFNLSSYSLKVGEDISKNSTMSDNVGLFVQVMAGLSLPLGDRFSIEAGARGSMITTFFETNSDLTTSDPRNNTTSYTSASVFFLTPYAAATLHF